MQPLFGCVCVCECACLLLFKKHLSLALALSLAPTLKHAHTHTHAKTLSLSCSLLERCMSASKRISRKRSSVWCDGVPSATTSINALLLLLLLLQTELNVISRMNKKWLKKLEPIVKTIDSCHQWQQSQVFWRHSFDLIEIFLQGKCFYVLWYQWTIQIFHFRFFMF